MDLTPYVSKLSDDLAVAAEAGGEDARALAERLTAPLDSAVRLTLLEALSAAAQEITCEMAPGSVQVRLRGRDPEFVVTVPPAAAEAADPDDEEPTGRAVMAGGPVRDDEEMARVNLRMPDSLKLRVDQAAAAEGLSVNAWLVRAATAALGRADAPRRLEPGGPKGRKRVTGWAH